MNGICKICGSKTRGIYHKRFNVNYYYCNVCEFISKDEESTIKPEEE